MEVNKVYSFILSPGDAVKRDIRNFKTFCRHVIGSYPSLFSKAHVTICEPYPERKEVMLRMIHRLMHDLQQLPAAKIKLNGFKYFVNADGKYVIYVSLELNAHLKLWFQKLRLELGDKSNGIPHITIARGISATQFKTLWPHFENFSYQRTFTVKQLTILKSDIIKAGPHEVYKEIPFGNADTELKAVWTLFG